MKSPKQVYTSFVRKTSALLRIIYRLLISTKTTKKSLLFSFSLIGQIGLATALPLVVFGLAGRYLDKNLHTSPWLFLFGLVLATVQVYFYLKGIVKKAQQNVEDI